MNPYQLAGRNTEKFGVSIPRNILIGYSGVIPEPFIFNPRTNFCIFTCNNFWNNLCKIFQIYKVDDLLEKSLKEILWSEWSIGTLLNVSALEYPEAYSAEIPLRMPWEITEEIWGRKSNSIAGATFKKNLQGTGIFWRPNLKNRYFLEACAKTMIKSLKTAIQLPMWPRNSFKPAKLILVADFITSKFVIQI